MGSRIPSHQLRSGLYVSGRPEQLKADKQPTMASRAVPYTGGDVKKSGELGKMFDIPVLLPTDHHQHSLSTSSSSSAAAAPPSNVTTGNSNTINYIPKQPSRHSSSSSSHNNSGSMRNSSSGPIRKSSGPISLPTTGLITSGPLRRSGQLDPPSSAPTAGGTASTKPHYGSAVTCLSEDAKVGMRVSRPVVWVVAVALAMGLLVGAFLMVAVKKGVVLVAVGALILPLLLGFLWNCMWGRRTLLGFVKRFPDAELRAAIDGQYVKVTGVVTCGSIPLESSYQRIPRCVYVSTELYEYRGWRGKSAHPKHKFFSWGSRHSEKYVADFYISDFQSGLRALVKAGYGAKVAPFVKPATIVDVAKENRDLSPSFLRWLADRNLSSDDRIMRLKEGYIKEGSTVSVMGVVRRHDNVLMIVPPQEPVSTGCQWSRCLLPTYVEGVIVTCDDSQNADVVPV
ncbi:hypothetical protein Tsubulata_033952 [Turnera subulata]|uniref:Ubiquitin-specific protease family C19-related protein n=1 Tax=Turnera subulata TaxID=218843 RepID=A0A9Q0J5T7_9ROSI|nr:hypothetical protein Tsubulata_033952 [Turnera subulata]